MKFLDIVNQISTYGLWALSAGVIIVLVWLLVTLVDLLKDVGGIMGKVNVIKEKTDGMKGQLEEAKKPFAAENTALPEALATIFLVLTGNRKKHDVSIKGIATAAIGRSAKKSSNQKLVESVSTVASAAKTMMKS